MNKFLAEILEQPESVKATLDFYLSYEGKKKLKALGELFKAEAPQETIFTGMGSSYFASIAASCLFNNLRMPSCALNTSELLHYHFPVINNKTPIVCVSQSGESFEVVKLLEKLPDDVVCIGITNEEKSSLTKRAKEIFLSLAGREEMTSTKTYTTTSLVMFILGWYLAGVWGEKKVQQIEKLVSDLKEFLSGYEGLITDTMEFLDNLEFVQFIGRGPSFSTALQSELMFKEAAKIAAAGTLGGEFRHGPMEMVRAGFKSILFAADGKTYNQSIRMALDIARYQGKVVVITNKLPQNISSKNVKVIVVDQPDEYLFSIQSVIPVQLMVNHLALTNGHEPGKFIHGGKVTLTE